MSLDFYLEALRPMDVFESNYTHNVTNMWREAGCYDALYRSDGLKAFEALPFLRKGEMDMRLRPEVYKKMNPENGWGCYDTALAFLQKVIRACEEERDATIRVSR
jgi:hypothetical protein